MKAEEIKTVAVLGVGTMGQGIAQNFAQAGLMVRIVDLDMEILRRALTQIKANLELFREYNLLKEDVSSVVSRIQPVLMEDLDKVVSDCDYVLETVPEDLELKKQLFARLDSCPAGVIVCSNSSSYTMTEMTGGCRTADRMVGTHYFNPAHILPLVEIHSSPRTRNDVIATAYEFMLRVGKQPIILKKELPGFVVNRLQAAIGREIMYLITEDVVSLEDLNKVAKSSYGFRNACLGNIETMDLGGLDTVLAAQKHIFKSLNNSTEPSPIVAEKVKGGNLGLKTGKGWFDWTGYTRAEVIDNQNRRLLKQLALFKELDKEPPMSKPISE